MNPAIDRRIYMVRAKKVMLDSDLAELYRVTTGNLNLAVRRNIDRFPPDFMFQLTTGDCGFAIANCKSKNWPWWTANPALRLYRAGCGHALFGP